MKICWSDINVGGGGHVPLLNPFSLDGVDIYKRLVTSRINIVVELAERNFMKAEWLGALKKRHQKKKHSGR